MVYGHKYYSNRLTGNGLSSLNRLPGQPKNENKTQLCVRLEMQANVTDVGQFNDFDCAEKYRYICEVYELLFSPLISNNHN
jgi:hypothetical protein